MAKRLLAIVIATAAASFSAQAWAGDGVSGSIKVSGAFGDADGDNLSIFTVDGAFSMPLYAMPYGGNTIAPRTYWSVQGNGGVANIHADFGGPDSLDVINLGGHFTYNNYASGPGGSPVAGWRGGVYAGLIDLSSFERVWDGGIEGQMLVTPNLQIEGRAGIYTAEGESISHFYIGGNFFPIPSFKLNGHGFVTTTGNGFDISGVGGSLEYMPSGGKLSLFASVDSVQSDGDTITAGRVGLTVPLGGGPGGGSLFDQAVRGPTLGNGLVIGILPFLP